MDIQLQDKEITVKISSKELEKIIRKEIRTLRDEKMMTAQQYKIIQCYKKDGIALEYNVDKEGNLIAKLKET